MTIATLEQALPDGDRRLLDTTSLLAYFDRHEMISPLAIHVVDEFVSPGRNPAVVSMVTVMEALVRPLRAGAAEPYEHLLDFLTRFPNLRPMPIDMAIAQEAASPRAASDCRRPTRSLWLRASSPRSIT